MINCLIKQQTVSIADHSTAHHSITDHSNANCRPWHCRPQRRISQHHIPQLCKLQDQLRRSQNCSESAERPARVTSLLIPTLLNTSSLEFCAAAYQIKGAIWIIYKPQQPRYPHQRDQGQQRAPHPKSLSIKTNVKPWLTRSSASFPSRADRRSSSTYGWIRQEGTLRLEVSYSDSTLSGAMLVCEHTCQVSARDGGGGRGRRRRSCRKRGRNRREAKNPLSLLKDVSSAGQKLFQTKEGRRVKGGVRKPKAATVATELVGR